MGEKFLSKGSVFASLKAWLGVIIFYIHVSSEITCCESMELKFLAYRATNKEKGYCVFQNQAMDPKPYRKY